MRILTRPRDPTFWGSTQPRGILMSRRKLPLVALLLAALAISACADAPTGPAQECQVTQGQHDCKTDG